MLHFNRCLIHWGLKLRLFLKQRGYTPLPQPPSCRKWDFLYGYPTPRQIHKVCHSYSPMFPGFFIVVPSCSKRVTVLCFCRHLHSFYSAAVCATSHINFKKNCSNKWIFAYGVKFPLFKMIYVGRNCDNFMVAIIIKNITPVWILRFYSKHANELFLHIACQLSDKCSSISFSEWCWQSSLEIMSWGCVNGP